MSRKEEIQKLLEAKRAFESGDSLMDILDKIFGLRGPQGEKGERGEQGIQGEPGRDGINGRDGKDGKDGKQGLKGERGPQGERGLQGISGKDGKDGKNGKDLIITEKLEGFIKKIIKENLPKYRQVGGGGMGNVIVETPSGAIDGINTTFTLSTTPKNNAIILTVNGQFQRKDIDFTISGKTITMLWNIPTGSDIFIWFIRN